MDIRNRSVEDDANYNELDMYRVQQLKDKIFKNYESWCKYLHCPSNLRSTVGASLHWPLSSYMGGSFKYTIYARMPLLYLPQCSVSWRGSFLRDVVTPIYEVIRKEARRNQNGTASHSSWRNYDDLNEYFWSDKCLKLG
ncbi:hypothetical protein K7X08_020658 [Anisodus acutangulus]|uniref:1,3-beta-glucan synthase component FKS1-like domain-containing protein n=1 Tax=Anisodus acutangulus TaxID=402998 RepID=A0A9Q1MWA9_9SOLA|nr:hypothetical protein K7X08_020658 [Anisodus acutangulus]